MPDTDHEPLSFFVQGNPQTQGGMRQVPVKTKSGAILQRQITTGSTGLLAWRRKITNTATYAVNLRQWEPLTGPVQITLRFLLPMPRSRPAGWRRFGIGPATVLHDIDKMERAVLDSLKLARVYRDDGQVARVVKEKYEMLDVNGCGVEIVVAPWPLEIGDPGMIKIRDRRLNNLVVLQARR